MPYSFTVETINGIDPLAWEITDGALPPGLNLNVNTGEIFGTATELGVFSFSVQATDSTATPQVTAANLLLFTIADPVGNAVVVSLSNLLILTNGNSLLGRLSTDGRFVTFTSVATNLTGNDTNGVSDVFVRDTCRDLAEEDCTPATVRVSAAADGEPLDGASLSSAVSATGRYVAFASLATNLVANDTNGAWDIFLRDTCIGEDETVCTPSTIRVSVAAKGSEAQGDSVEPAMSSDGRFIAFRSLANNLVAGDINGAGDIFVRDTCTGVALGCKPTTIRASVDTAGAEANSNSLRPSLSPDGRFVAFESLANNLVAGDSNGAGDIFVRDTCLGAAIGCTPATLRASLADDGSESAAPSFRASVSSGGRYVVFETLAGNLVANDTNMLSDVFVRDTCLGAAPGCVPGTVRVSLDEADAEFNASSTEGSIGGDGRSIAFATKPTTLPNTDFNSASEIYVRDTCLGEDPLLCTPATMLASLGDSGFRVNQDALRPSISEDGTGVVFQTGASTLTSTDTNGVIDVYFASLREFLGLPGSDPQPSLDCDSLPPNLRELCLNPQRRVPLTPIE